MFFQDDRCLCDLFRVVVVFRLLSGTSALRVVALSSFCHGRTLSILKRVIGIAIRVVQRFFLRHFGLFQDVDRVTLGFNRLLRILRRLLYLLIMFRIHLFRRHLRIHMVNVYGFGLLY